MNIIVIMEGDKMTKETKHGLRRRIHDGEGFGKEPRQRYFTNKIADILWWIKVTRERFKPSV